MIISLCYIMLFRYLRLGAVCNIYKVFDTFNIDLLCICLILIVLNKDLLLFLKRNITEYIFKAITNLIYSFHIKFLQKNFYFSLSKKIYKTCVFFSFFLCGSSDVYGDTWPKPITFISFISRNTYILTFFVLLFIPIEIYYTNGFLQYSIYILFFYPLIYNFFSLINIIAWSDWRIMCNFSDYAYRNFENPRYPFEFWRDFTFNETLFPFSWSFTDDEYLYLEALSKPYINKLRFKELYLYKITQKVIRRRYPLWTRLHIGFRSRSGVRYMHTIANIKNVAIKKSLLNSFVPFFADTLDKQIVVYNDNAASINIISHFESTLKRMKKNPYPINIADCYINGNPKEFIPSFKKFAEDNGVRALQAKLEKYGVVVTPYKKGNTFDNITQPQPDASLNFKGSKTMLQGFYGVDYKSPITLNSLNNGAANTILQNIDNKDYSLALTYFRAFYEHKVAKLTPIQEKSLAVLDATVDDEDEHISAWISCLRHFPTLFFPPQRAIINIAINDMLPERKAGIRDAAKKLNDISDRINHMDIIPKIPLHKLDLNKAKEIAVEQIFQDSIVQRLMQDI
jgi:hypothetical protein